jgi:hypothetical protein
MLRFGSPLFVMFRWDPGGGVLPDFSGHFVKVLLCRGW